MWVIAVYFIYQAAVIGYLPSEFMKRNKEQSDYPKPPSQSRKTLAASKMKKQTTMEYNKEGLDYLKNLFYDKINYENLDHNKLNRSLNLFYGLEFDEKPNWKKKFKGSLIREVEKTKIEEQKFINITKKDFDSIDAKDIIKQAFKKKEGIQDQLNKLYKASLNLKFTIIYEAPPFSLLVKKNDGSYEFEFDAEFILDDICSSPYSDAIKSCFSPGPVERNISDILLENNCGFFDVIPFPLPITSNLRKQWATEEKFLIDGERIFVHFFKWALEAYKLNLEAYKLNNIFSNDKKHNIAIGIPLNNAISLYEYYAPDKSLNFGEHNNLKILFNAPHTIDLKKKNSGLWIHPYKNCVISTSNTPNAELMKLAFDLTSS